MIRMRKRFMSPEIPEPFNLHTCFRISRTCILREVRIHRHYTFFIHREAAETSLSVAVLVRECINTFLWNTGRQVFCDMKKAGCKPVPGILVKVFSQKIEGAVSRRRASGVSCHSCFHISQLKPYTIDTG